MIKNILILLGGLAIGFFSGIVYLSHPVEPVECPACPSAHRITVEGTSMEPRYKDGSEVVYINANPEVGDVVVFKCLSGKCLIDGKSFDDEDKIFKVLEKQEGDQYWFNGINSDSYDSDDYGWIGAPDIEILGVVLN